MFFTLTNVYNNVILGTPLGFFFLFFFIFLTWINSLFFSSILIAILFEHGQIIFLFWFDLITIYLWRKNTILIATFWTVKILIKLRTNRISEVMSKLFNLYYHLIFHSWYRFVSMNVKYPIWSKFYRRKKCGIKRDLMNMLFY